MARVLHTLLLAVVAGTIVLPSSAQTVRTRIDTDSVSIGQRYTFTVSIRHDGSRAAVFPDQRPGELPRGAVGLAGDFEILRRLSSGSRTLPDNSQLDSVRYEVASFAVDTARVVAVVGLATASDTTRFAAIPGTVPVRSVLPEGAEDILDLAPLVEFPRTIWPWVLGLIVAGLVFWYFFVRRRPMELAREEDVYVEPAEPPFDEAMRRLGTLARRPPDAEAMKPYFVELSDIVRTYIARRTAVPARELSTGELIDRLGVRPVIGTTQVSEVGRLLTAADLVKFADHRPGAETASSALTEARDSIERTEALFRPKPHDTTGEDAIGGDGVPIDRIQTGAGDGSAWAPEDRA